MITSSISSAFFNVRALACFIAAFSLSVSHAAKPAKPSEAADIPSLSRTEHSDWINVQTEVSPAAVGNGIADDTAALQAALNFFDENAHGAKVVYLPPGTYRITSTLIWPSSVGCNLIGHGRDTIILWDGANNSRMMRSNGGSQSRFDGITWDANNRNTIAVNHNADLRFEASPSHYNSAYLNASFGIQGNTGGGGTKASSEMFIENCLFENCGVGIDFSKSFNYYNEVILRCEFRNNGFGVTFGGGYGYVRFCHFENTTHFDIQGSTRSTARFCTSVNSGSFYNSNPALAGQTRPETRYPGTLQNCVISGWTYDHAIAVTWNSLVFDNVFENPRQDIAPIYIYKDDAIVSENLSEGTTELYAFAKYAGPDLVEVPAGNRTRLPLKATDSFLQSSRTVPTVIFDAVADFGAQPGTSNDDTAAVQATINAAANHGRGAIADFPSGRYGLSSPIRITGANYIIGGTGYHSEFEWVGTNPGDVMFAINDPQDLTVEHLGFHSFLMSDGCTAIQQNGTTASSITYTGLTMPGLTDVTSDQARLREGLHLKDLGAEARVYLGRVNGRARIEDCGRAQIIGEFLNGTHPLIDGADHPHTGLTGFATMNTHDLVISDNQSLVVGDLNLEQSAPSNQEGIRSMRLMKGAATNTSGRVTVGAGKVNLFDSAQYFEIDDYEGQFSFLHGSLTPEEGRERIELVQNGSAPLDLFIGAVDTSFLTMPILVDAGPSLTLTTLANHHAREVPDEWYGGAGTWIESPIAIDPDLVNFALQFDGIADFLMGSVESPFGVDNSALTAMTWLKPTASGQEANLMGYMSYLDSRSKYTWYLRLNPDDTVEFVVKLKDSGATVSVRSSSSVNLDQWTHLVGSWDGAVIRIYVNGIEEASAPAFSTRLNADQSDRLLLGGSRGSSQVAYFYEGALDEARIYDIALSPAEIGNHYINSFGLPNENGLVAGWHFNEGSSINFFDYNDPTGGYHLYSYEYGINHNPLDADTIAANALDHFREFYAALSVYNIPALGRPSRRPK